MAEEEAVVVEEVVVQGQKFPDEWDALYSAEGQTAADAPPGYITLFANFFGEGNFRLPATNFMLAILHFYAFHISQLIPMGMVRIRNFEFICRSQGLEPSVARLRVFYQLIRNMGFYSFALRNVKKILINPPKIFHERKMKFLFIREEVMPIAVIFCPSGKTEKEDTPIP
ncbi:hypothetical protein Hanom_Chr06g00519971 [Helianthus anomalus]